MNIGIGKLNEFMFMKMAEWTQLAHSTAIISNINFWEPTTAPIPDSICLKVFCTVCMLSSSQLHYWIAEPNNATYAENDIS